MKEQQTSAVFEGREGFRIAQNLVANPGFYVRPDDQISFSPVKTYGTAEAAWNAFDRGEA